MTDEQAHAVNVYMSARLEGERLQWRHLAHVGLSHKQLVMTTRRADRGDNRSTTPLADKEQTDMRRPLSSSLQQR